MTDATVASTQGWRVQPNAPLRASNTFGVACTAPWLLEIYNPRALPTALNASPISRHALLPLGAGSNILFVEDPKVCIVQCKNQEIQINAHHNDADLIYVGAGCCWHRFVLWALHHEYAGIENLALIPGTVGASVVQNIGAYGVQVAPFVHSVCAYDTLSRDFVAFSPADCAFGYRDSLFIHTQGRYLIYGVVFRLPYQHPLQLDYPGITATLAQHKVTKPTPRSVAQAVIAIRQHKLPDPQKLGNAGSFFKNPLLSRDICLALQQRYPSIPVYPVDAQTSKLSAAWLIEACGWKGQRHGQAGVYAQHALVLVNYGNATGREIYTLARQIAHSVHCQFGVQLQPEPRIIGATWE